jgi:hypothetical protein
LSALQSDADVIVDNTNTTLAEIAPYVALAQAFNAECEILWCRVAKYSDEAVSKRAVTLFTKGWDIC